LRVLASAADAAWTWEPPPSSRARSGLQSAGGDDLPLVSFDPEGQGTRPAEQCPDCRTGGFLGRGGQSWLATGSPTFPFPRPTDEKRGAIAAAARELVRLRDGWLDPPGLDPVELGKRTLTNLYNARPTWLAHAHAALDTAVLAAYGWRRT